MSEFNIVCNKYMNVEYIIYDLDKDYYEKYLQLNKLYKESENYIDSKDFFRNLRNSLARGKYETKIDFIFYDDFDKEDKNPKFKYQVSAHQLLNLIKNFELKVNAQLDKEKKLKNTTSINIFLYYFFNLL